MLMQPRNTKSLINSEYLEKAILDTIKNGMNRPLTFEMRTNNIRTDGGTQTRVKINDDVAIEYALAMEDGATFPPIDVFVEREDPSDVNSKTHYWLADGFHRLKAARLLKKEYITATQHVGTLRDAVLFALKANAQHGLRRTNEDKRKAVLILLQDDEWKCLSSEQIAEKAAVSKMTVTRIKKELSINNDVIGKDGKIYKNITLNNELIEAKKYYIVKFDMEIKAVINDLINISKKNENALMLEAIEYLINKYNKPNN